MNTASQQVELVKLLPTWKRKRCWRWCANVSKRVTTR